MNISEFERAKPTQTYKLICDSLKKYKKIIDDKYPPMDSEDVAQISLCEDFLADLTKIKNKFIEGK